jgi:hypothetical protein
MLLIAGFAFSQLPMAARGADVNVNQNLGHLPE